MRVFGGYDTRAYPTYPGMSKRPIHDISMYPGIPRGIMPDMPGVPAYFGSCLSGTRDVRGSTSRSGISSIPGYVFVLLALLACFCTFLVDIPRVYLGISRHFPHIPSIPDVQGYSGSRAPDIPDVPRYAAYSCSLHTWRTCRKGPHPTFSASVCIRWTYPAHPDGTRPADIRPGYQICQGRVTCPDDL